MVLIIVDVQGFKMPVNQFIVKELAVLKVDENDEGELVVFQPPCKWSSLPDSYKRQNLWCERNHHGIPWNSGDIPYHQLKETFDIVLEDATTVYVKGLEKKKWITDIIGTSKSIIDLEDLGCPALQELRTYSHDDRHRKMQKYSCAMENARRLRKWFVLEGFELDKPQSLKRSLELFCTSNGLREMTTKDIAHLPKTFILKYAWNDIDVAWDNLPDSMQIDNEIMGYRRCRQHRSRGSDQFDGPPPFMKNCSSCQIIKL